MKILYAVQGTGNGHISRARDIIPHLEKQGTVDILISGTQADVNLGYPVTYKCKGLSFVFGKNGGIDLIATYKKGKLKQLWQEIKTIPVEKYDLIINDFEPVSAWACILKRKVCMGLSHQAAVLNTNAPKPAGIDVAGTALLKYYAPAAVQFGFHFKNYDTHIYTPVIRQQVRDLTVTNKGHYTVYLPAYDDKRIIKVLSQFTNIQWQVFSKHNKTKFIQKNISIQPIVNEAFLQSMAAAEGVLCGAGFETPAEAMYLQKKLMVIPMKGQYEQQCNAAALQKMGVPVIKTLKLKHSDTIKKWVRSQEVIAVNYPDETKEIIHALINQYSAIQLKPAKPVDSFKKFRIFLLNKLLGHLAG